MLLRRRIGLLVMGFFGSLLAGGILVGNCVSAQSVPVVAQVSFPKTLEGTPLVVKGITGYEGPYVEDGTDEEVTDVAALTVYNAGEKRIGEAVITVKTEQESMCFVLTELPAGEAAIVLEQERKQWVPQRLLDWQASYVQTKVEQAAVEVRVLADGYLEISNLMEVPLQSITLLHKTWSEVFGGYLGGITYRTRIEALQPGQLLLIKPDHFAPNVSRIIAAVQIDTKTQ